MNSVNRNKKKKHGCLRIIVCFFLVLAVLVGLLRYVVLPKCLFPRAYRAYVEQYAAEYNLEPSLVYAVMKAESNFAADATSHKDAMGLMQVISSTGEWAANKIGLTDYQEEHLYEPQTNIQIGCWYLNRLIAQFQNTDTAIAAYNAGEGNVAKWLGNGEYSQDGVTLIKIPYEETASYVETVRSIQKVYVYLYES